LLIKRVSRFTFTTALTCMFCMSAFLQANAQLNTEPDKKTNTVTLAAAPFETYVSDDGEPARVNSLVSAALAQSGTDAKLKVMRQAFLGSAVRAKKVDGEYALIDMGQQTEGVITSNVFLPLYLYAASKDADVEQIDIFPHLKRNRVAIENRFANTPNFRLIKDIKWSRNPSTFDAFRQLADDRAPYLITSELLIREFNTLLANDREETLHYSAKPLMKSGFQLAIRDDVPNAQNIIDNFNTAVSAMQKNGQYNKLLQISWLRKDINQDGIADYIGHSHITRASSLLKAAYNLDSTPVSEDSVFVIDGNIFTSKAEAFKTLSDIEKNSTAVEKSNAINEGISLLDATTYETLLKRW
jgi:polar amino acid transport system substrate-binding protein